MCGDLLNLPRYNLHPFESRSPQGRNEHGPVQMSGVSGKFFFLMKRQRNGRENLLRKALPSPDSKTVVLVSAPANGLKRVIRVPGRSRHPPQRRNARARNGVVSQSRQSFAGTVKAARRDGRSKRCR
uniref:Uncharacterized protein n=1 Tax=Klebsiella pneumoniae TaxID=573 RepID=A0A2P1BPE9_KLEPN|nr:hypothetical protein [Klebsiella pneumoniae]